MSIYRTFDKPPANDVHVHHVLRKNAQPDVVETPSEADWARAAEAAVDTGSLKTIVEWVESMPANVQPRELTLRFPRVATALWALWNEPPSFYRYVKVLLLERRDTNRQGFPGGVLRELFLLREYYATLHPDANGTGPMTTEGDEEPG